MTSFAQARGLTRQGAVEGEAAALGGGCLIPGGFYLTVGCRASVQGYQTLQALPRFERQGRRPPLGRRRGGGHQAQGAATVCVRCVISVCSFLLNKLKRGVTGMRPSIPNVRMNLYPPGANLPHVHHFARVVHERVGYQLALCSYIASRPGRNECLNVLRRSEQWDFSSGTTRHPQVDATANPNTLFCLHLRSRHWRRRRLSRSMYDIAIIIAICSRRACRRIPLAASS